MKTLVSVVYEDELSCALLDGKYFREIGIDDKGEVKAKCLLCAQEYSAISGTF